MADVTVPDEISDLDAAEVEQRLERLFDGESSSSLAAQEIETDRNVGRTHHRRNPRTPQFGDPRSETQ